MAEPDRQPLTDKLLVPGFTRADGAVSTLSDPIADTPMVVTLDQLKPYNLNPRITRNPRHDDIKASIRERGLDAPPTITRRPGEETYVIRNGGNTRLAILRELWSETREERFFRIACLFRPWTARGEIVALTGHLAENELRGSLSFIERALGVEKARELYESESGAALNQTELARRLTSDGYPIGQSHISRMQDAVRYLLPAIPTVLYAGLGRPQIERLAALRRVGLRVCERHAASQPDALDFAAIFQEVLAQFDGELSNFNVQRVQDEVIGQLAELFQSDYDALALEFVDADSRQRALTQEPMFHVKQISRDDSGTAAKDERHDGLKSEAPGTRDRRVEQDSSAVIPGQGRAHSGPRHAQTETPRTPHARVARPEDERIEAHIVSQASTTPRLEAIQKTLAQASGESTPNFRDNVVKAIPVQAGGLHPISDVWYIEPALDVPDRLRAHVAQLAREIAQEAGMTERIEATMVGVGFVCSTVSAGARGTPPSFIERAVLALLHALSAPYVPSHRPAVDGVRLVDDLGGLLQGSLAAKHPTSPRTRLSDEGLIKLFRLIRLSRRILDLETTDTTARGAAGR
jgi:ParB family protein of integrating conjugative element (PFGI_1 class)